MAIQQEITDSVATITIDRPEALNAFNSAQLMLLRDTLMAVASNDDVRVIILTGAGKKAFAAGADIAEMKDKDAAEGVAFAQLGHSVCSLIETMTKPVIAAVNGFALGGGCELSLACDIRIAAENAVFGQPEVGLGIPPGWGATQRLARVVGDGIARELIFTGRTVKVDEAKLLGLVNAVYPQDELLEKATEMAREIAAKGPQAVGRSKDAINRSWELGAAAGQSYEAQLFGLSFATADQKEGMDAFLSKRRPEFIGK